MGVRAAGLFALSLAGCAQVFGLDPTTGGTPDGPSGPPLATLQFDRLSIGTTIERAPADLTGMAATFMVPDATAPNGMQTFTTALAGTKDRWNGEVPEGVVPMVEFTLPEATPLRRLYAFDARTTLGLFGQYEHQNPTNAATGGTFQATVRLPSLYAGELVRLYAVGPWVYHDFGGAEVPAVNTTSTIGPTTIAYDTAHFASLVGPRTLPALTSVDQMVALRYTGNDLTASALVPPFNASTSTDSFDVTLMPVTHAPLDVHLQPNTAATRLNMTSPANPTLSMAWSVVAAPAWQYANNSGPVLQSIGVAQTDTGDITTPYGNPFESLGWKSLFTWNATKARTYTPMGQTLVMTLHSGIFELAEPTAGVTLDLPAGLPVLVSINKTPLTSDGLTVTIDPAKAVELSLVADKPTATFYQFNVYEIVPNTAVPPTALDYKIVYAAYSLSSTVMIPHDILVAGKMYTIRAHCIQGGYPMISTGNLQERNLPVSVGYLDSGVFAVAAP
jgi:hypothetical protein